MSCELCGSEEDVRTENDLTLCGDCADRGPGDPPGPLVRADFPTLLAEAVKVIERLADQQAMPDYGYGEPLARFKAALREPLENAIRDATKVADWMDSMLGDGPHIPGSDLNFYKDHPDWVPNARVQSATLRAKAERLNAELAAL
jgi:ribosome-binding protein aMBF1 (putative translation factor)